MKSCIKRLYRKFKPILNHGDNNTISISSKLKGQTTITIIGNNNKVIINDDCLINDVEIVLYGNNNILVIQKGVRIKYHSSIYLNGNAFFEIGQGSGIGSFETQFKDGIIKVGEKCMFSVGIVFRNDDGHRVFDKETNLQTNHPGDITIGNHVWVCKNASIIKKCSIGDNSIIAFGAVVTKGCEAGCILAGNPAKVVKENISWDY